jgi:hypothetical protein
MRSVISGYHSIQEQFSDDTITKWDIFYYVYAVLHHPAYRAKYAENLKRDLPRLPLAGCHSEEPDPIGATKNPGSSEKANAEVLRCAQDENMKARLRPSAG